MQKKLYRSSKDKMLGGVAAGLAEYFDIDPTLVRVIFVITLFMGGTGVLAYILLWIIVPEAPFQAAENINAEGPVDSASEINPVSGIERNFSPADDPFYYKRLKERKEKRMVFAGIVLIILGMIFLADNFIPRISFSDFFPLFLIAIGAALLLNTRKNKPI